jgi:hypothetical protein
VKRCDHLLRIPCGTFVAREVIKYNMITILKIPTNKTEEKSAIRELGKSGTELDYLSKKILTTLNRKMMRIK